MEFLELLEKDPQALTRLTIAEYAERGGLEGAEVVMWLIMRGALSNRVRKTHQSYYLPSMTAIASVIFENEPDEGTGEPVAAYRARIAREWAGIEKLQGTYPFTIERSVKAYRLNAFLHRLIEPKFRRQFLDDAEPLFQEAELSDEERGMIRRRDWRGAHPLRRHILPSGEARRGGGHHEPAYLCRDARAVARGIPENPQCAGSLFGGRTGPRQDRLGRTARMTVRKAVFDLLRAFGVTRIFGNPGSTELPLFRDFPRDFRYVLGLQESIVVGMADGYAAASGGPAFVNLHSAIGVGHALGGIFTAFRNQTPLVITAGQQARSILPFEPFLFSEQATNLPKPYVKWSCEPARAADVPLAIARAFHAAMQPPRGPTLVSVPVDDWDRPCESGRAARSQPRRARRSRRCSRALPHR